MVPLLRSHNSFINFRFKHLNFRGAMRAAGSASTQNIDTNGTEHPPPAQQQQQQQQRVHWDQVPQNSFTELGINKSLYATAGGARFRQHVNPLKRELQVPAEPLDYLTAYDQPTLPLILDVGCGYGRFLLALAKAMPGYNGMGLEIREPVVDRANRWADGLELQRRVRFVLANATVSVSHMLGSYPGPLSLVCIQFPDPHFKKRHRKRRVVQPQLVAAVRDLLPSGGRLFLQSDVLDVAEDMRDQFEREAGDEYFALGEEHTADPAAVFHKATEIDEVDEVGDGGNVEEKWKSAWAAGGWLIENPLPVPTERELHVLTQNLPVYRIMLVKK